MSHHTTTVRRAADHSPIHEEWGSLTWLAGRQIGNAQALTLGRVTIKPGRCNPRHCHHQSEEVLYLLNGHLAHTVGDETVLLGPGDTITIAPTGTRDFEPEQ
mgnify:FL=1